jgi:asparagine synthase (glutamine-hydrolysing)
MASEHTEVTYGEPQAVEARDIVREMEVPFCDAGINVGTWLLGKAAAGRVSYVLTGDGGDELWASHPVYAAQRLLRVYERLPLPRIVRRSLVRATNLLPDSDQKRDLRVKLKRILPSDGLPRGLGPFRWRAYYTSAELQALLTPEAATLVRGHDPFRSVLDAYQGYDGPDDGLSPHLYNDYTTTSSYYFQRLGLLRRFGIEARMPFFDRALVEFGARIPARLKLEGVERTKRLFRVAMEGVLPDVINHRRDKLGHSIPLKNWLRAAGELNAWVEALLTPEVVRWRGLVRPAVVARLLDEHRRRRHNHSHRLWALVILEAWLQACRD